MFYNSSIISSTRFKEFIFNNLINSLFLIDFNSARYFVIFKNNFIYYFKIYYIRYKSEIFIIFLRFKTYLKSLKFYIYRIRINNEEEYIS